MSKATAKTPEPRSVRLTQAHRQDMLRAVMEEWEKQNPAPCQPSNIEIFKLIVREIKKHPQYKATQKILEAVPEHAREGIFRTLSNIIVRFVDKDGNVRDTKGGVIPMSVAKEHGLVPSTPKGDRCFHGYGQSTLMDIEVNESDVQSNYTQEFSKGESFRFYAFNFLSTSGDSIAVQISDELPAMKKIKEGRKALKEWEQERDRLQTETADLLQQFNTSKQLRDGWPDMVPYMPPHIADPDIAVKLPVLATSRLSQRLGIKKHKAA